MKLLEQEGVLVESIQQNLQKDSHATKERGICHKSSTKPTSRFTCN